jgi:hypothetical protein
MARTVYMTCLAWLRKEKVHTLPMGPDLMGFISLMVLRETKMPSTISSESPTRILWVRLSRFSPRTSVHALHDVGQRVADFHAKPVEL